jgi:hypothetical protein
MIREKIRNGVFVRKGELEGLWIDTVRCGTEVSALVLFNNGVLDYWDPLLMRVCEDRPIQSGAV